MVQPAPSVSTDASFLSGLADAFPQPLFDLAGIAAMILFPLVLLAAVIIGFLWVSSLVQRNAALKAMQMDTTPGNKILIATVRGKDGRTARDKFMLAMEKRLPDFNFGSAFYMGAAPISLEATDFALSRKDYDKLDAAFEASGADLIVWGQTGASGEETRLCFATPATIKGSLVTGFFTMDLKGKPSEWADGENLAMAYVAGKRLRPSIGRPADFRAERFQPILHSMSQLLDQPDVISGDAKTELEDDFAAGALHVGEALSQPDWLQKSIDLRTRALQSMKQGADPIRWAQAKIGLGRAMCRLCETKFEPAKLQEAMTHIREGIDSTKSDSRMQLAETGFQTLQRAEQMLADRRRFSIRWSV